MRGISVQLTEGNEKTLKPVKSLLPNEVDTETFPAVGNPGEAKIDVTSRRAGESNKTNNAYTYHVAFQS